MFTGLEYKKIHAYPNNCVFYKDDFAALKVCVQHIGYRGLKKKLMEIVVREK